MKTTIIMFLSYAFLLAAPIASRLGYLLDIENYGTDSNDIYDYR